MLLKIMALYVTAWLIGLSAYMAVLALFSVGFISFGDLWAVMVWSLVAFTPLFFLLYLPALWKVRRLLYGVAPMWPFPVAGMLLGFIPTTLIVLTWSGTIYSLFSLEALLFYAMFAVIGCITGLGFAYIMDD